MPVQLVPMPELENLPFVLLREAATIAKFADYEMKTPDGRRYGLFWRGGEPLLHFLEAMEVLITKKDRRMLKEVEGMIVEVGSEDPPLIYGNFDFLMRAWISLHILYGVPESQEESELVIDVCSDEYYKLFSDPLLDRGDEDIARQE
jgi:hypothetical protein